MDSETLLAMSSEQQLSYWLGRICISIGGCPPIKSVIAEMKNFYQLEAYTRGVAAGKAQK